MPGDAVWHKVAEAEELAEGQVKTVQAGARVLALCRHNGGYGALDNTCPHAGGPLGEGSIEDGWLICPWHGKDFDPLTGEGHESHGLCVASYAVQVRGDGVYVGVGE